MRALTASGDQPRDTVRSRLAVSTVRAAGGIARSGCHPFEIAQQIARALLPVVRILRQARADDAIERRRRDRLHARHRRRLVLQNRADQARARLAFERLAAREHLEQHAPNAKMSVRASASALRSARAPCTAACRGSCPARSGSAASSAASTAPLRRDGRRGALRQAEVEQLRDAGAFVSMMLPASDRDGRCPRGAPCRARRRSRPRCVRACVGSAAPAAAAGRRSASVSPSRYSSTRKSTPSLDARRRSSVQMCGWLSDEIARASRSKRSRSCGSAASARGRTLIATVRSSRVSRPVDLAHAARADERDDFIGPRRAPGDRLTGRPDYTGLKKEKGGPCWTRPRVLRIGESLIPNHFFFAAVDGFVAGSLAAPPGLELRHFRGFTVPLACEKLNLLPSSSRCRRLNRDVRISPGWRPLITPFPPVTMPPPLSYQVSEMVSRGTGAGVVPHGDRVPPCL